MSGDNLWALMSPAERERFGSRQLTRQLAEITKLRERFDAWEVYDSSRLAEDNAASEPYRRMTWELHYLMSSALDHLEVLKAQTSQRITPFAPYSLIRSPLESAAIGLWLQSGGRLDKRLLRLLQLQWHTRERVDVHSRSAGIDPTPNTAKLERLLDETKAARRAMSQYDYKRPFPKFTMILTETDKLFRPSLTPSGLNAWRTCSGVAHGNMHFATGLSVSSKLNEPAKGGATTLRTASAASLALMLGGAIAYVDRFMTTLEMYGQPRGHRPA